MNKSPGASPPTEDAQIAHKITNALIIRGVSINRLADETGISYPTLRRSLKGGRSLSFNEFGRIAHALEVQPSHLLPDSLTVRQVAA